MIANNYDPWCALTACRRSDARAGRDWLNASPLPVSRNGVWHERRPGSFICLGAVSNKASIRSNG